MNATFASNGMIVVKNLKAMSSTLEAGGLFDSHSVNGWC